MTEFFLTLVMLYPQDPEPRRFYYSYSNFRECDAARQIFTKLPKSSGAAQTVFAVCSSGQAPPKTEFQRQEDEAILKTLREYFR